MRMPYFVSLSLVLAVESGVGVQMLDNPARFDGSAALPDQSMRYAARCLASMRSATRFNAS